MEPGNRYIFLISRPPGAPSDPETLIDLLVAHGVEVDADYGAVPIDPRESRFILRGTAQASVIEALGRDPDIDVFADPQVHDI